MAFIKDSFLLQSKTARHLYETYAADEPILDYHTHLPPEDVANNRRFENLYEIWLEGDHYKWRAMRANGVPERYCTGNAEPYEKFLAWAGTVPYTLRNPLYHWTHLELKRYFGIDDLLDEDTAPEIWERANALLTSGDLTAQGILKRFHVRAVCTSDDPTDTLEDHRRIAASGIETRIYPTFRPDRAIRTNDVDAFNAWIDRLSSSSNVSISRFANFLDALRRRHDYFHEQGCRLSDHGLDYCHSDFCTETEASTIFDQLRARKNIDSHDAEKFATFLMVFFGRLDAEKGWTKQLHLGAYRNVNTGVLRKLGRDVGFDSIGDWPQAEALGAYLGRLTAENALPKIVLYNLNPADNYVFATMIGNFQDESVAGKVQFGSGWWFLDQKEAMEWQLNALSNCGLLSRFVGMLTDSRSFMSYPRHEYFRRVLCNLIGSEVEGGLLPDKEELIGPMIRNICFSNAATYFGLDLGTAGDSRKINSKSQPKKSREVSSTR
ncbi:MAG TPA: glucuronate isomerase [Terriglobales bacterium]